MNLRRMKRNIIYLLIPFFLFSCTKEELPLAPSIPLIPLNPSIPNEPTDPDNPSNPEEPSIPEDEKMDMKITISNYSSKIIIRK